MKVSVTLDERSYQDTLKALERFGKDSQKAIKGAVDATALAVETDAKNKLKEDRHIITSRLRSSIHAETKQQQRFSYTDDKGNVYDGSLNERFEDMEAIAGTNVTYAPHIEFGTAPHVIVPKNKKFLAFKINGETVFAKRVNHPGTKGDSFMRYAAEKQRPNLQKRVAEALNKLINQGPKK